MRDLKKANHLIAEIARENKYISPVSFKDLDLFQKFFKHEPHTYGNSWTYVVQGKYGIGPYGLGYKYYDGKNLSSFSIYPKMEQPDILCIYWTRPMGPNILDIINKYTKELLKLHATPSYVKKIFKDQFLYLKKKGFKDTTGFPWHSGCPSEDDTYPEIIINAKATVENESHSKTIRNILKRYRSLLSQVMVRKIINDTQKQKGWKVARDFFQQHLTSLSENISTSEDFYNVLFASKSSRHELFLILKDSFSRGIFDLERLDNKNYSTYAALMLREKLHNLNDFSVIYRCYRILQKKGSHLNMGGSETEGLHKFKSKFIVARENKMYWATLY